MENISEIQRICFKLCDTLNINRSKIKIIDRGCPHNPTDCKLSQDCSAVYIFKYKDVYLKIGKVGKKSHARFSSHHYSPNRSESNLAKSILNDSDFSNFNLNEKNITEWMKNNLHRIDIIFDNDLNKYVNSVFESTLHYFFKPTYEGRQKQLMSQKS